LIPRHWTTRWCEQDAGELQPAGGQPVRRADSLVDLAGGTQVFLCFAEAVEGGADKPEMMVNRRRRDGDQCTACPA
jgi:hypothetical protein